MHKVCGGGGYSNVTAEHGLLLRIPPQPSALTVGRQWYRRDAPSATPLSRSWTRTHRSCRQERFGVGHHALRGQPQSFIFPLSHSRTPGAEDSVGEGLPRSIHVTQPCMGYQSLEFSPWFGRGGAGPKRKTPSICGAALSLSRCDMLAAGWRSGGLRRD